MSRTENFRRQHKELLAIATEISAMLDPATLATNGAAVRAVLSRLAGQLTIHLAMEDKGLYPRLLSHADPKISALAKRYADEMGGIKEVFTQYMARWPTARAIESNAQAFIDETQGIFAALGARIDKEDNELYPLVDRVG